MTVERLLSLGSAKYLRGRVDLLDSVRIAAPPLVSKFSCDDLAEFHSTFVRDRVRGQEDPGQVGGSLVVRLVFLFERSEMLSVLGPLLASRVLAAVRR